MQQLFLKDLLYLRGKNFGTSDWHTIDQEMVNQFSAVAGDTQWIHIDTERAKESIFGGTIVPGYLTLSLAPKLMDEVFTIKDAGMGINRGLNRLRFLAPLSVGDRVCLNVTLEDALNSADYVDTTWILKFEGENYPKPVCLAHVLKRFLKDDSTKESDDDESSDSEEFVL